MRLTCFIVEDEPLAMQTLMEHCADTPELELVGSASTLAKAEIGIYQCRPQLIFLDLHLSDGYGFTLLPKIADIHPLVIVTSGYRQYALEGFKHGVIDYLEKPIYPDRFEVAINRIRARLEPLSLSDTKEQLVLGKGERKEDLIYFSDIVYVEAYENYVKIFTDSGLNVRRSTLKYIQEQLPLDKFLPISRSYIVALGKILRIQGNNIYLRGNYELSISKNFRPYFDVVWNDYKPITSI